MFSSQAVLTFVLGGLTALWWYHRRQVHPTPPLPPCPCLSLPAVGHLPYFVRDGPVETLHKWRKSKGDIFGIWLGQSYAVVLSSYGVLKEAFVRQAEFFSDRPMNFVTNRDLEIEGNTKGIVLNNGLSWKEQRHVSMQILREFGMGKNWLADKISEEVEYYLKSLSGLNGQAHDVRILTNAAVSNVICAMLVGHRFDDTDPLFRELIQLNDELFVLARGAYILSALPFLWYIPGDLLNTKRLLEVNDMVRKLVTKKFIHETIESGDGENFIARYIDSMKKKKEAGKATYKDDVNLERTIVDLFLGGSETTSSTILWSLAFAINYPGAQKKCYREIIEVVGPSRSVNMSDRQNLVYVNAYIMETQRLGSIGPLGLFHESTESVELCGYKIPQGTTVIPFFDAIFKDSNTWEDPLIFKPERFIDNGKLVIPDEFIPFGVGPRCCLGESLARMELFLFNSSLLSSRDSKLGLKIQISFLVLTSPCRD